MIPAPPSSKVLSDDPSVKAQARPLLEYDLMVLIPLFLILEVSSFLEHGSRLVTILVFWGRREGRVD